MKATQRAIVCSALALGLAGIGTSVLAQSNPTNTTTKSESRRGVPGVDVDLHRKGDKGVPGVDMSVGAEGDQKNLDTHAAGASAAPRTSADTTVDTSAGTSRTRAARADRN